MAAAEQTMQSQLAGPTIALLDDMPADLWTRLSNRLSTSTAAAAQVTWPCLQAPPRQLFCAPLICILVLVLRACITDVLQFEMSQVRAGKVLSVQWVVCVTVRHMHGQAVHVV